jgi:hypothetical protein
MRRKKNQKALTMIACRVGQHAVMAETDGEFRLQKEDPTKWVNIPESSKSYNLENP